MKATEKCHILRSLQDRRSKNDKRQLLKREEELPSPAAGVGGRGWARVGVVTCRCCSSASPRRGGSRTACRIRRCCRRRATPRSEHSRSGSWSLGDRRGVSSGPGPAAKTWNLCWLFRFRSEVTHFNQLWSKSGKTLKFKRLHLISGIQDN